MYRIAVIKHWGNEINEDTKYYIDNIVEFASTIGLEEMKETLEADYLIPVPSSIDTGNNYDNKKGIFTDYAGNRIYPPLTLEERIYALEDKINNNNGIIISNPNEGVYSIEEYIIRSIKKLCETIITNGFDYDVLGKGNLHYALSSFKQKDLEITYQTIKNNIEADYVLWRDEGRATKEKYTVDQFIKLYQYLMTMIQACKFMSDIMENKVYQLEIVNDSLIKTLMRLSNSINENDTKIIMGYLDIYVKSNKFDFSEDDLKNICETIYIIYRDLINKIVDVNLSELPTK